MTPEDLTTITTELKRFGTELNLTDAQKEQLKTCLTEKYHKLQEFRQQNPNASKDDLTRNLAAIRSAGREKLARFLTPDQLTKWDAEIAKSQGLPRSASRECLAANPSINSDRTMPSSSTTTLARLIFPPTLTRRPT